MIRLQLLNNGCSVFVSLGLATQVASQGLALREGVEDGLLNASSVLSKTHMSQHHDGAEQEGGRVSQSLAGNIGSGTMDSFEDGALVTDVARGSETQTTNQAGAHVGQNVTVQVGHDEDLVVVGERVGDHLEAGVVEELSIKLDAGEVLGNLLANIQEETVRHLHNGGLVDDADLGAANRLGVLESESEDTLRSFAGDELDALNNAVNNDVLNAGVFTLGVLSDQDGVNIVVWGLEAGDGAARSQVGKEVESSAEGEVKRDVALANGGL